MIPDIGEHTAWVIAALIAGVVIVICFYRGVRK
jgi:hypothetical protein